MVTTWKKVLLEGDAAVLSDTAPVDVTKATADAGVASDASRRDHKHNVSTAQPTGNVAESASAAEGTATSLARSDHVHACPATWAATAHKLNTHNAADGAVNCGKQQMTNMALDNQSSDPSTPVLGQIYFKTGDTHPYICTVA
jgi:hypothetical protein